jgi:high affinity Mn2+ porin
MPLRWTNPCLLATVLLGAGVGGIGAQTPNALPSAPDPAIARASAAGPAYMLPGDTAAQHGEEAPKDGNRKENEPVLTMAPHPEGTRYWISGQSNVIFQGRLPFHSPYEGTNSFRSSAEYKTSVLNTLYLAVRPTHSIRYANDLILNIEQTGGRGLSNALGLAGFTNLDVVRNPNLSTAPYLARYSVHQVIGLTDKTVVQEAGPFALATTAPERRIELRVGRMSLPDFFDVNAVGSDSHLQFMNWTVDNNGAWDYAADTRGYTVGGMAEYDDRVWSLRFGTFAMPTVANGIDLDWAFSRSHGNNTEFELRRSFVRGHEGTSRILFYDNRAHMGNYRQAVIDFLNGSDTARFGVTVPTITLHATFGALKYGVGYNVEQEVTANLRVFGRFGWNDGATESYAYTECEQTFLGGGDYRGTQWGRPEDKAGLAVVSNAIKKDHQNYLMHGGLGFILGDGNLNYGRETIEESYYNMHVWRGLYFAVDVQHINNPGYNRDRGPAWVGSVRGHIDW